MNKLLKKTPINKLGPLILSYIIYVAIILIWLDVVTTVIGIKLGLEETNVITLMFMKKFGSLYGLIISMTGKSIIVIFPLLLYQFIEGNGIISFTPFLKKIYFVLFVSLIILTIITTLKTDIENTISIINRLQYIDYIRNLT